MPNLLPLETPHVPDHAHESPPSWKAVGRGGAWRQEKGGSLQTTLMPHGESGTVESCLANVRLCEPRHIGHIDV